MSSTPHTDPDNRIDHDDQPSDPLATPSDKSTLPDGAPLGDDFDWDAPWHSFMRSGPRATYDPVTVAATLRQRINELPDTKTTFRLVDLLSHESGDDPHPAGIKTHKLVELTGAWPAPPQLAGGSGDSSRWVNHNAPDAAFYSDVMTHCDCGAVMVHKDATADAVTAGEHDHTDDCPVDYRLHARARVHAKRRHVLKRVLHLGFTARSQHKRLGMDPNSLGQTAERLGVNITDERTAGRHRCARTWARLLADHPPNDIAAAYGCHRKRITTTVRNLTAANPGDLYQYRRDNGLGNHAHLDDHADTEDTDE